VFVLKVGRDLLQELTLLDRISWLYPDTATVVIGDSDNPVLVGLIWDLGATVVLFPPLPRYALIDVIDRLLEPPRVGGSLTAAADADAGSHLPSAQD
jgi:hypothetical protein